MILLTSNEYKYRMVLFRKSGCSTMRNLFLKLHFDELPKNKQKALIDYGEDSWHIIHMYINYGAEKNDYYTYEVVRNTYKRVVSMYFNRVIGIGGNSIKSNSDISFRKWLERRTNRKYPHDKHYEDQIVDDNFEVNDTIELSDLESGLIEIYRNIIFLEMDVIDKEKKLQLIKSIISDRKQTPPKNITLEGNFSTYNFEEDKDGVDIFKNGIPNYKLMYDDDCMEYINKLYEPEIKKYGFVL